MVARLADLDEGTRGASARVRAAAVRPQAPARGGGSDLTAEVAQLERGLLKQYGAFLPAGFRTELAGANLGFGLGVGFVEGFMPYVPPERLEAFRQGLREPRNFLLLQVGQSVGIIIGAGEDLYHNLAGLAELAGMGIRAFGELPLAYKLAPLAGPMAPAALLSYESARLLLGDPEAIARQRRVAEVVQALSKFHQYIQEHPDAFLSLGEELGRHAGKAAGEEIYDKVLNEPDYYWRGVAIGRWAGMVLMEVALLFLGPEEWILRGAVAAGRAGTLAAKTAARALRETAVGRKVLSILRETPELSRLLRVAREGDEAARGVAAGGDALTAAAKAADDAEPFVLEGSHTPASPDWARATQDRAVPFEPDPSYGPHLTEPTAAPGAEAARATGGPHARLPELEPHRAPEVKGVKIPARPRGFNSGLPADAPKALKKKPEQFSHLYTGGRAPKGRPVKPGQLTFRGKNVLEPTAFERARRPPPNYLKTYLQRHGLTFGAEGAAARETFEMLRPVYKRRLGMKPGEEIHHAIELQVLDYYPDVFTPAELNALGNMRGIPDKPLVPGGPKGSQLHQSFIRNLLDERYRQLDEIIESRGYMPGYPDYNRLVRDHIEAARREVDALYGHLFRWPKPEVPGSPFVGSALGKAGMLVGEEE